MNSKIMFLTSNGNGALIILALSEKFPEVEFSLEYDNDPYLPDYSLAFIKAGKIESFYTFSPEQLPEELKSHFIGDN